MRPLLWFAPFPENAILNLTSKHLFRFTLTLDFSIRYQFSLHLLSFTRLHARTLPRLFDRVHHAPLLMFITWYLVHTNTRTSSSATRVRRWRRRRLLLLRIPRASCSVVVDPITEKLTRGIQKYAAHPRTIHTHSHCRPFLGKVISRQHRVERRNFCLKSP